MYIPFPKEFAARVKDDPFLGKELLDALDLNPPVSIRFHSKKQNSNIPYIEKIPWCENAVYLETRPSYTLDPLFHAGAYYPQEAGSMVLDAVLRQLPLSANPKVLDLCAAPGGKSTLIASFMENKGLLVSNEVIQQRSKILKENLSKWGYTNTIVTNNDPKDFCRLEHFFDVIVIDAPCSGEGMFRKDSKAREEWSENNVQLCSGRQKRIVMDAWDALKPGGFLIYSTCTFNSCENEENVKWFSDELNAVILPMDLQDTILKGREEIGNYCIPGKAEAEGFYIAVLQKTDDSIKRHRFTRKNEFRNQKDLLDLQKYVSLDNVSVINWNNRLLALPADLENEMLHVQAQMRLQKMGTCLGEIAKKGIIPNEELALDSFLNIFQDKIDLDQQRALQFLHGDTFGLDGKHGFCLITFQNESLGWIKHLGNRFNNLYPKEWRIRMNV